MFDTARPVRHQRSHGHAAVGFDAGRLTTLRQQGSAKALLPHVRSLPEVVFLNTSGGLTSGDTLSYGVDLQGGTRAVATTQAAERAYRADHGPAQVQVTHQVGPGGWLDWLPQETILFDRADLVRETTVHLAPDAGCLLLEAVVLGRAAMGEVVQDVQFSDMRRINRAGKPVFFEPFMLTTDILAKGPRSALLGPARAFATLVLCAPGGEDAVGGARAVLTEPGVEAAASGFDGKCVVRLLAEDGWPLRKQILKLMHALRRGSPPPRVWQT
ncbi:urease accessory protein UreD [Rhodobacter sp. TJ_12]|uniref:urease accessory protein UreD n=1 Tax=Rhodobacter sp. TJ_12 TaxID=2029399 RepID=UPI001CBE1CED|nr:urease accessory protein UreD [Rhodobacter sp. TJ_12]MBZ4021982.1 urease accessory protein UreD [Rhodobacter sp. TJ_12]